ncbi:MAG: hypothetical protein K2P98_06220 [Neisseriaceae bacterium]|nr:hypothetical protein [Neisseriaceae bacterium]
MFYFITPFCFADTLPICYQYGCKIEQNIQIPNTILAQVQADFAEVESAEQERQALALALRVLYLFAGSITPISVDKGGNFHDGTAIGRMDCIDHSSNTTTFLTYLANHNLLRFHQVGKKAFRAPWILNSHYAAQLVEIADGSAWVVDTWFKDFGELAVIVPYDLWHAGYEPN